MNFFKKIILTTITLSIITSLSLSFIGCPPAPTEEEVVEPESTPEAVPPEPEVEEEVTEPEPKPVLVGLISYWSYPFEEGEYVEILPLVAYENGEFRSLQLEKGEEKISEQLFRNRTFWLYQKGTLIATGDFVWGGAFTEQVPGVFTGRIFWKVPEEEIMQIIEDIFSITALSHPIPQPFWPPGLILTSRQSSSLERVLQEALLRAFQKFRKDPKDYLYQRPDHIEVIDLDQDDQPEIYASRARRRQETSGAVVTSLLATWKNGWIILLEEGGNFDVDPVWQVEGNDFTLNPVDINGDGIAELLLKRGYYETWEYFLYRLENGQPVEVLYLGGTSI